MPNVLREEQQPWQDYILVNCFATYYAEVARVKEAIANASLPAYLTRDGHLRPNDIVETAAMLSSRLREKLDAQTRELRDGGTERLSRAHRLARYVMVALSDELLILGQNWEGKDIWLDFLLERKLFGTCSAGRDFFLHAERLMESRVRDTIYADLASVFLIALQLGFQGRYRGPHGTTHLLEIRQRLLRFIVSCRPARADEATHLFPQTYVRPLSAEEPTRLAPMKHWYRYGAIALGAYLIISTGVWMAAVAPLTQ